jgi:hypothetical protein
VKNGPATPPAPVLASVNAKTSGLGLVRFDKARRTITFECWPYSADVAQPGTQMETWPLKVGQLENYARKTTGHLPELKFAGVSQPLVEVIEEKTGELVYLLRPNSGGFRPHVFAPGKYTVRVSDPETGRTRVLNGLEAGAGSAPALEVRL